MVPQGALARVPPLVVHGFRNGSDKEMRYLNFHAPGVGFADYMRGLRDGRPVDLRPGAAARGGRPPGERGRGRGAGARGARGHRGDPGRGGRSATRPPVSDRVESFYVLEGELAFGEQRAPAGSWVDVPPGASAVASQQARYLRITAPR